MNPAINQLTDTSESTYILTYRDGIQSLPVFGFVQFNPTVPIRSVIEKCQTYCRRHHYRFVSVRPSIINVLEEEDSGEVQLLKEKKGPQSVQEDGSVNHNHNSGSRNSNRSVNSSNVETVQS